MKKLDAPPGLIARIVIAISGAVPKHPDAKKSAAPWHRDNFENPFMGYGTSRDKTTFGTFTFNTRLDDDELYALYYTDDISAKIVNKRPDEMLRRGYKLTSKKKQEAADELQKKGESKELQVKEKILRGYQWGRWWGGAIAIKGTNDSVDLSLPLVRERVSEMRFLNVVDRRFARVDAYQDDPNLPGFGEPLYYTFSALAGGAAAGAPSTYDPSTATRVHASRVIRFLGVKEVDPITSRKLGGWSFSVLQRPYEVVRSFATTFKSIEHLISDASQGVWKIQNLIELLGANRDELMTRLAFSDMTRSAGRAIMLDAENEDYERVATSFAGIKDVAGVTVMRLAAAADMPQTLLVGASPDGMNATGDSDMQAWYNVLETEQQDELKPIILEIYGDLCGGAIEDLDVEFPSFWTPTAAEQATENKAVADTDKIYFDMGLPAESIFKARFGSDNGKIQIDEAALDISLAQEIELMKQSPEEKAQAAAEAAALNPPAPPDAPPDPNAKDPTNAGDPSAKPPSK